MTKARSAHSLGILFLIFLNSPAWAQNPWRWESKTVHQQTSEYDFAWGVPKLLSTPGNTTHWQELLDRHVTDRCKEFIKANTDDAKDRQESRQKNPGYKANPWESGVGFKVVWADPRHLVLLWEGYEYRGGAHGLPVLEVVVLSSETPDFLLPPSSLFIDSDRFLPALSAASRAGLLKRQQDQKSAAESLDEWALKGTEPDWSNFTIIYPTQVSGPARFEVIFPPYQVGPYTMGTPTVVIPWQELSTWAPSLKDGFPLP